MNRWLTIALGVCLVGVLGLNLPVEGSPNLSGIGDNRLGHRRVEAVRVRVRAVCKYGPEGGCSTRYAQPVKVKTPAVAKVDVVFTASFQYKTSENDWGTLVGGFGDDAMSPGNFRLMSPSPQRRTSTTLTWVAKGVEAGGRRYGFSIFPDVKNGDNNAWANFKASRLLMVVEMWPAGA